MCTTGKHYDKHYCTVLQYCTVQVQVQCYKLLVTLTAHTEQQQQRDEGGNIATIGAKTIKKKYCDLKECNDKKKKKKNMANPQGSPGSHVHTLLKISQGVKQKRGSPSKKF